MALQGDRLVTGWSKWRRIAVRVAMQVVTAAVITDWSKWGRVVAVAIMVVPWAAIDCLVLADLNGDE